MFKKRRFGERSLLTAIKHLRTFGYAKNVTPFIGEVGIGIISSQQSTRHEKSQKITHLNRVYKITNQSQ